MRNNLISKLCNALAGGLSHVATMATNSVSLFGQYEHTMPQNKKK